MAAMSDYLESELLDHILNNNAYTSPTSVYVALFTAAPSDSGGGTEVSGGSYARVTVTGGFTISGTATRAGNTSAITFPTATGSWGTVTHVGVFDASSGGNLLFHGALTTSRAVVADDVFSFPADALGITLA